MNYLIERLRLHACYLSDWRGGEVSSDDLRGFIDDFNAAASALERYQWVPCIDRLPEPRKVVLALNPACGVRDLYVDEYYEWVNLPHWWRERGGVTFWMPIPGPPAEQGGE